MFLGYLQVTSDKEKHLMFAIFDENKSWYLNENIQNYSEDPNTVNTQDANFYKSNVMNSKYTCPGCSTIS